MKLVSPSRLLTFALTADAVASGAVAALQLAAASSLHPVLRLPHALLVESGVFLVAYTLLLIVLARSPRVPAALVGLIVAGNVGWAIGCLALPALGVLNPSALGIGFLAVQALTVLLFAALEWQGLKTSSPAGAARLSSSRL